MSFFVVEKMQLRKPGSLFE